MPAGDEPALKNRFVQLMAVLVFVYALVWLFYEQPVLSSTRLAKEFFVWPLTLGLLALYWLGFRQLRKTAVPVIWLVIGVVAVAAIAALIPPFHSTDLFGYINRGWQQLHYGMNPYVYTIAHVPGWEHDPMITNHWVNNPSPYGFFYLLIAKMLCAFGHGDKAQTIGVFKAFNVLVHLLTAGLVWLGVRRFIPAQDNDAQSKLALYLYAFNPLVLLHGLANGHNDMLMGFFVTLSAYCAVVGAWVWVLPALVLATLVKYGALVVIPPAILLLVKQRQWRALGLGLALGVVVFFICGLPYLPEWHSFHLKEIGRNALVSHGSLHSCIYSLAKAAVSAGWPLAASLNHWAKPVAEMHLASAKLLLRDSLKNALIALYALFYAGLGLRRLRQAQYLPQQFIQDTVLVMGCLIGIASLKFYPWYFGMFFPLVFYLTPGHWLRQLVIFVSCAQVFSITFIGQAHFLNFLVMTGFPILGFVWLRKKQTELAAFLSPQSEATA